MKYLCEHHRQELEDGDWASELWHKTMAQGMCAYQQSNWRLAQSFFGSAFEIALVRLDIENKKAVEVHFVPQHFADAGRMLASALCHVDQFDEAEQSLLSVHGFLLNVIASEQQTYDAKRHYLRLAEEFLKRATNLLRIRGKSSCADTVTLLSQKVTTTVRHQGLY